MLRSLALLTAAVASLAAAAAADPPQRGYAIVVSRATRAEADWAQVVAALQAKYPAAQVIEWETGVQAALEPLRRAFPRYACFVARPEEAQREFVVAVHRLTRRLDDDPYGDVLWAILTGYTAADAGRIAAHSAPLVVRRGAGGTSIPLEVFDAGRWYSEGEQGAFWEKSSDGKVEKHTGPGDSTQALVATFNDYQPDLFLTSGHATDRDWQIGYSYPNGQFRCRDGVLLGVDLQQQQFPIHSANPKVYLPLGNCLMGRIRDRQSMALAFMRSGGVNQMCGYVVSTWYGYAGWGVRDYFLAQPGRFTLAEACFANNQALVQQLESRFGPQARGDVDQWEIETDPQLIGRLAASLGYSQWNDQVKDHVGLAWDRDTLALYGDPAWEARLAPREGAWDQTLTERDGTFTLRLVPRRDATWGRPPFAWLPYRVEGVKIQRGRELYPVITDDFVLLTAPAKFQAGETYELEFTARPAARPAP